MRSLDRALVGAEADDENAMAPTPVDGNLPPAAFHFRYMSSSGQLTERGVHVRHIETICDKVGDPIDYKLTGLCLLRRSQRSFKASLIEEMIDLATGEIVSDAVEYFKINNIANVSTSDRQEYTAERSAINRCRYELTLLLFLGASDGHLSESEIDEMVKHVFNRTADMLDEDVIRSAIKALAPDEASFAKALAIIADSTTARREFERSMRRVIDADKRLDQSELLFAQHILNFFASYDQGQYQEYLQQVARGDFAD